MIKYREVYNITIYITFDKAIKLFLQDLAEKGKSRLTIHSYKNDLDRFVAWLSEWAAKEDPHTTPRTPSEVGQVGIQDYTQFLKTSGRVAPSTANRRIISLKAFYKYLHENNYIESNPTLTAKTKSIQRQNEVKWLTRPQVAKLFAAIEKVPHISPVKRERDKAILSVLVNCGLRVSELCNLKIEDVDLDNGVLQVFSGKGGKFRRVAMGSKTVVKIKNYLNVRTSDTEYLFASVRGGKMHTRAVQLVLTKLSDISGVEATPHMLRHTFAKGLADKTGKLEIVAEACGHSSVETSRRYVTPSTKEIKHAIECIEFDG